MIEPATPTHYVLKRGSCVAVKTAGFFHEQQGHLEPWGKHWIPLVAADIDSAREQAMRLP